MITVTELFPLHSTGVRWLEVFRVVSLPEGVRFINEYVISVIVNTSCETLQIYTLDNVIIHSSRESKPVYIYSTKMKILNENRVLINEHRKTFSSSQYRLQMDGLSRTSKSPRADYIGK